MADFFGVQIETPQEAQQRLVGEFQAKLAQVQQAGGTEQQRRANTSGFLLGDAIFGRKQRQREVDIATANEQAITKANEEFNNELASNPDPEVAQIKVLASAAAKMAAIGNPKAASELRQKLVQMRQASEERKLKLRKLKAETHNTEALVDRNESPQDVLVREQNLRDGLEEQLGQLESDSPAAKTVARKMDELNASIRKRTTVIGRTEQDVGLEPTRSTLNDLQKVLVSSGDLLFDLDAAAKNFDPEQFTLFGKAKNFGRKVIDILNSDALSTEQKDKLIANTQQIQRIAGVQNSYIKSISGTAVSGAEQERLNRQIPDPENDSPTQILTKIKGFQRLQRGIQRRALLALSSKDMSILAQPLDDFLDNEPKEETTQQGNIDDLSDDQLDTEIQQLLEP